MIFLDLLIGFLEVGFFSFGGAYSAIPLIRDVVRAHGWLDDEIFTYVIAISESTPGPIMVNMATYVGSAKAGIPGAVTATAAVVLPSFVIILLVMFLLNKVLQNKYAKAALSGLKPCVIGIILVTGVFMILKNCFFSLDGKADVLTIGLTCCLALVYFGSRTIMKGGISPILLICLSAAAGMIAYGI